MKFALSFIAFMAVAWAFAMSFGAGLAGPDRRGNARFIEAIASHTRPGSALDVECARLWLERELERERATGDTLVIVPERWRSMTPVVRLRIVADGMGKWEGE